MLTCSSVCSNMPLLWALSLLLSDFQMSLFTHITYRVNFCLFPSILLLPWAASCEMGNPNGKLVNNYVLNNSSQILPWGSKAIPLRWSFLTTASVLRGFVLHLVAERCSHNLELPGTCTLGECCVTCIRNFEMYFMYRQLPKISTILDSYSRKEMHTWNVDTSMPLCQNWLYWETHWDLRDKGRWATRPWEQNGDHAYLAIKASGLEAPGTVSASCLQQMLAVAFLGGIGKSEKLSQRKKFKSCVILSHEEATGMGSGLQSVKREGNNPRQCKESP